MFKRPAIDSDPPVPARYYLPNLSPLQLLDIDERLRSYYSTAFQQWTETTLAQAIAPDLDPALQQSLLFLSAGHYDGRIRQSTLASIAEFPGYLTLAIALIRCADWVEQVRLAAQDAVVPLLDRCSDEDVVAVWPLVLRLRSRERTSQQWLERHVEQWMFRGETQPCLRALLRSDNAAVRVWVFERSLEAGISLDVDLLDTAIRDPSPTIGLHALRYARLHSAANRVRLLAETGLRAPHPVIRRESLRTLAALNGAQNRELLLEAACDKSSGVRSLATFLLRERYDEDAVTHWRAVLDRDGERPTLGALVSLADRAQPQDATRMRRWLSNPNGLIRMHCLRGLLKAAQPIADEELVHLMTRAGSRVMRFVAQAIGAGDIPLGVDRVAHTVVSPIATPSTLQNLRTLLQALSHWDRLSLLLRLHLSQGVASDWWHQALDDWIRLSNRYAPLGPSRRRELLELVESRRADLYDAEYALAKGAIERH